MLKIGENWVIYWQTEKHNFYIVYSQKMKTVCDFLTLHHLLVYFKDQYGLALVSEDSKAKVVPCALAVSQWWCNRIGR